MLTKASYLKLWPVYFSNDACCNFAFMATKGLNQIFKFICRLLWRRGQFWPASHQLLTTCLHDLEGYLTITFFTFQAPCGVSSARQLVSHALLRWRQRMLRADNTSAIVVALQLPGSSEDTLHHEEVLLDLSKISQCPPASLSRADTPLLQVRADELQDRLWLSDLIISKLWSLY